ncbi:leucine-rich repeat-containing protein 14 isoform 1-T2 [Leptodactylus fuscus]|uniref:leucine-rich repeat-containing protein 14-like n=1 Tax=Leptodactylus fuscus TaxID=238119 RepID=UPI003F4F0860
MLSLVFICSRRLVSDRSLLRRALPFVPDDLYRVLFRAAFMDKKTLALQELVRQWPFPFLILQSLLQEDEHLHPPTMTYEKANRQCMQAIILSVVDYLKRELVSWREGRPPREQQLRLLDLTDIHDNELEQDANTLSFWPLTVLLAKSCIKLFKRLQEELWLDVERRRESGDPLPSGYTVEGPLCVDVQVDLFVNSTSYSILQKALQGNSCGPLRLHCRDFRVEELSLRRSIGLLQLLNPISPYNLRQIDLRFNNLGLCGLNTLMPYIKRFTNLRSLKLPYSNVDVILTTDAEDGIQTFSSHLCQLPALKELNLGSSRLSEHLQHLLWMLPAPLESLELAFCSLFPVDLRYLSSSIHVSSLKKLDLSGHNLRDELLQPFLQLLAAASSSLLFLDAMECKLSDASLSVLTPVLGRCRHLRYLGLFDNPVSIGGVRNLLHRLLFLSDLRLVIYPLPSECYQDTAPNSQSVPSINPHRTLQFDAEVQEVLVRANRTDMVWTSNMVTQRPPEYLSLEPWMPRPS